MNLYGQQKVSDSTTKVAITRGALSRLLTAALQRDVLAEKIGLLVADTALLSQRVASKQRQVEILEGISEAQVVQIDLLREKETVFKEQLSSYERLLRKEKRKRFLVSVAGVLTTGFTTYLLLKK